MSLNLYCLTRNLNLRRISTLAGRSILSFQKSSNLLSELAEAGPGFPEVFVFYDVYILGR